MGVFQTCFYWHSRGAVWQNVWKRGSSSRRKNETCWTEDVAKAIGEKTEIWNMIEVTTENGEQLNTILKHLYGQTKKVAWRAMDKAKREMEEKVRRGLWKEIHIYSKDLATG